MESKVLRVREVGSRVGVSKATLYRMIKSGRFPKPINVGARAVGWRTEEVDAWIAAQPYVGEGEVPHETLGRGRPQTQVDAERGDGRANPPRPAS